MATPDFTIKTGDTAPPITCVLEDADEAIVPLDDAVGVRFVLKNKLTLIKVVDAPGTIVDAPNGKVSYQWIDGDTATPGNYNAEWEVHWSDDTYESFPNWKHIQVKVFLDLGGDVTEA